MEKKNEKTTDEKTLDVVNKILQLARSECRHLFEDGVIDSTYGAEAIFTCKECGGRVKLSLYNYEKNLYYED